MKCQILCYRKNQKKYFKMSSTEIFTQHAKCYFMLARRIRGSFTALDMRVYKTNIFLTSAQKHML